MADPKTTDDEPITDAMAEKYTRDDEACVAEFQTTDDEPTIRIGGLLSTADGPSTRYYVADTPKEPLSTIYVDVV